MAFSSCICLYAPFEPGWTPEKACATVGQKRGQKKSLPLSSACPLIKTTRWARLATLRGPLSHNYQLTVPLRRPAITDLVLFRAQIVPLFAAQARDHWIHHQRLAAVTTSANVITCTGKLDVWITCQTAHSLVMMELDDRWLMVDKIPPYTTSYYTISLRQSTTTIYTCESR
jgi:hypothetical protein